MTSSIACTSYTDTVKITLSGINHFLARKYIYGIAAFLCHRRLSRVCHCLGSWDACVLWKRRCHVGVLRVTLVQYIIAFQDVTAFTELNRHILAIFARDLWVNLRSLYLATVICLHEVLCLHRVLLTSSRYSLMSHGTILARCESRCFLRLHFCLRWKGISYYRILIIWGHYQASLHFTIGIAYVI